MTREITPNWQVSINDTGKIVKDFDDIAQCIFLVLSTMKGSDPLRPEFGSEVYAYLDKPMNLVEPMLVYEVFSSLEKWEKRVRVRQVQVVATGSDKRVIKIDVV